MALDCFLVYICCTVMSRVLQSIFNNNFNFLVFIYLYIYLFGQKCCFCGRFGASIVCEMPDCGRIYHYPCAMAARTYQVRAENISLTILFDKVEQKYRNLSVASEILINLDKLH